MLKRLKIRDFGIIDDLEWCPSAGLNVLTGETGAGKSLVLDALDLLLGRRAGQEIVRSGAEKAVIEAEMVPWATEPAGGTGSSGLGRPDVITLRREVERSGRGGAFVDGRSVPVRALKDVASRGFDLHGPNQQFSLLDTREQLAMLDGFARTAELRGEFAAMAARLREVRKQLGSVVTDERQVTRRRDLLTFEIAEIRGAELNPGEDVALEEENTLLSNMERLRNAAAVAADQIYGGEQVGVSASDRIGEALRLLREVAHLDRRLGDMAQAVEAALSQVEDAGRDLASYRDALEYAPDRHEQIRTRLDLIRTLKKKYGGTIEEILAYGEQAERELETLESGDIRREQLEIEEARLRDDIAAVGERLSAARREAACTLEKVVEAELSDVNMAGTGFMVSFALVDGEGDLVLSDGGTCGFTTDGIDDIEFLIRPNPGEPFVPLARTASTGETSRLMLALQCALSRGGAIPTLVFDEIDIGVGGRSGEVIGRKLALLARQHQVICITHLPQVAAYGDSHFSVQKLVARERTFVELSSLEGETREQELSDMLGALGEPSVVGARELLSRAKAWKAEPQG